MVLIEGDWNNGNSRKVTNHYKKYKWHKNVGGVGNDYIIGRSRK